MWFSCCLLTVWALTLASHKTSATLSYQCKDGYHKTVTLEPGRGKRLLDAIQIACNSLYPKQYKIRPLNYSLRLECGLLFEYAPNKRYRIGWAPHEVGIWDGDSVTKANEASYASAVVHQVGRHVCKSASDEKKKIFACAPYFYQPRGFGSIFWRESHKYGCGFDNKDDNELPF